MQIVDAVEIHVFCMPCKGGLPHSKVEIGGVHAFYDNSTLMLHHVQEGVQIPNIPLLHILHDKIIVLNKMQNKSFLFWKMNYQLPQACAISEENTIGNVSSHWEQQQYVMRQSKNSKNEMTQNWT